MQKEQRYRSEVVGALQQEYNIIQSYASAALQTIVAEGYVRRAVGRDYQLQRIERSETIARNAFYTQQYEPWFVDTLTRMQTKMRDTLFAGAEEYFRKEIALEYRVGRQAMLDVEHMVRFDMLEESLKKAVGGLQDVTHLEDVERDSIEREESWLRAACVREVGLMYLGMGLPVS
eukprot:PhF_6_TR37888/c5_g1_i2/m.56542